jgi:hypothetical protein
MFVVVIVRRPLYVILGKNKEEHIGNGTHILFTKDLYYQTARDSQTLIVHEYKEILIYEMK